MNRVFARACSPWTMPNCAFLGRLAGASEALAGAGDGAGRIWRSVSTLSSPAPPQPPELWRERPHAGAWGFGLRAPLALPAPIDPGTPLCAFARRCAAWATDLRWMYDEAAELFCLTPSHLTGPAGLSRHETSNPHLRWPGKPPQPSPIGAIRIICGHRFPAAHGRPRRVGNGPAQEAEKLSQGPVKLHANGIAEARSLDVREQAAEALLMGLRLVEGVDLANLETRFAFAAQGIGRLAQPDSPLRPSD